MLKKANPSGRWDNANCRVLKSAKEAEEGTAMWNLVFTEQVEFCWVLKTTYDLYTGGHEREGVLEHGTSRPKGQKVRLRDSKGDV